MTMLYLVRHGENTANLTKEFSYKLIDYPLTAKGVLQAQQTATYFAVISIDAIYASPLLRAVQTAEIIAQQVHVPVTVREALRELNVGALERQPVSAANWELFMQILAQWHAGNGAVAFPEGEDHALVLARFLGCIQEIVAAHPDGTVILVGHGGIFAATISALCPQMDSRALADLYSHNCSISEVVVTAHAGKLDGTLIAWGQCDHLSGAASDLVSALPDDLESA